MKRREVNVKAGLLCLHKLIRFWMDMAIDMFRSMGIICYLEMWSTVLEKIRYLVSVKDRGGRGSGINFKKIKIQDNILY